MTVFADTFALIAWLNPRDETDATADHHFEQSGFRAIFK